MKAAIYSSKRYRKRRRKKKERNPGEATLEDPRDLVGRKGFTGRMEEITKMFKKKA